jgi:hypothetical protein
MKQYTLYFSFFGRKIKHTITAHNEAHAKKLLEAKINYIKVKEEPVRNPIEDFLRGFK